MQTTCVTPGRNLVRGQTTKSPTTGVSIKSPERERRFSGSSSLESSPQAPRIRFVPIIPIRRRGGPFQADMRPCTLKAGPAPSWACAQSPSTPSGSFWATRGDTACNALRAKKIAPEIKDGTGVGIAADSEWILDFWEVPNDSLPWRAQTPAEGFLGGTFCLKGRFKGGPRWDDVLCPSIPWISGTGVPVSACREANVARGLCCVTVPGRALGSGRPGGRVRTGRRPR